MGKKGPLWWTESDWLLRGSSAANQILLRHSGPILSPKVDIRSPKEEWQYEKACGLQFFFKKSDGEKER